MHLVRLNNKKKKEEEKEREQKIQKIILEIKGKGRETCIIAKSTSTACGDRGGNIIRAGRLKNVTTIRHKVPKMRRLRVKMGKGNFYRRERQDKR